MYTIEASGMYVFGNFKTEDKTVKVAKILNNMHILINENDDSDSRFYVFKVKKYDDDDNNNLPFFDFSIFLN